MFGLRRRKVELDFDPDVPAIGYGDESLLRHILTNLLSNAVKYSPPGGSVLVHGHRDAADAVLEISDHGIGIPHRTSSAFFQSFHRGKKVGQIGGTGLGLVIVKRCCEVHRGSNTVGSEEGRGTTFTVRLPLLENYEAFSHSREFPDRAT